MFVLIGYVKSEATCQKYGQVAFVSMFDKIIRLFTGLIHWLNSYSLDKRAWGWRNQWKVSQYPWKIRNYVLIFTFINFKFSQIYLVFFLKKTPFNFIKFSFFLY